MIFGEKFRRKYALSEAGEANVKKGTFWTVVTNLIVMAGIGFLYLLMKGFMAALVDGEALPPVLPFVVGVIAFAALSFMTHYQQYHYTYSVVYDEVGHARTSLAERLRKLPLSFFAHRDLAELTETMMSDVDRLEHVWSHVLGYLYGGYISTAIIAVMALAYDWRLALACLWGVPAAFALLFGSRKVFDAYARRAKAAGLEVADGIQETLESMREIRATNQEERYLNGVNRRIDEFESRMKDAELRTGIFVNSASVIMRLGMSTTVLVGASLILSGAIDFMTFFMFLLMVTRVYAPFDQSLALIAEVFVSDVSVARLNEVFDAREATGSEQFSPAGHDIAFSNVGFSYGASDEAALDGVTFTAREGEVTALVGPSGSGKNAPVVLLDEATASLDVENETKVQGALSHLLAGKTVLVIAHRMRTVMGANKIVVLDDGHVVEQGTPEELLERDGSFARMVAIQSQSASWSLQT